MRDNLSGSLVWASTRPPSAVHRRHLPACVDVSYLRITGCVRIRRMDDEDMSHLKVCQISAACDV